MLTSPVCMIVLANYHSSSCGFQVPDSSDLDDQEQSEDEDAICEDSQEDDMTPVESPIPKKSISIEAIDLTAEDSEPIRTHNDNQPSTRIILETQSIDLSLDEDDHTNSNKELPIMIKDDESVNEACEYSEDDIEEPDYDDSEAQSDEDSDKENEEESDNIEAVEDSDYDWNESLSDMVFDDTHTPAAVVGLSEMADIEDTSGPHMFHDNRDIPVSNVRTTLRSASDHHPQVESDQEENSLFDHKRDGIDDSDVASDQEVTIENPVMTSKDIDESMFVTQEYDYVSKKFSPVSPVPLPPVTRLLSQANPVLRQPSPSDAAMVKSTNELFRMRVEDVEDVEAGITHPADVIMWNGFQPSTYRDLVSAQTLGYKTGKHDFFQAREINRTRVGGEDSFNARQWSPGVVANSEIREPRSFGVGSAKFGQLGHPYNPRPTQPTSEHMWNINARSRHQLLVAQQEAVQRHMKQQQSLGQPEWAPTQSMDQLTQGQQSRTMDLQQQDVSQPFLPGPSSGPYQSFSGRFAAGSMQQFTRDEPDMTSAYSYHQSKIAALEKTNAEQNLQSVPIGPSNSSPPEVATKTLTKKNLRSVQQDLRNTPTPEVATKSLKRKAPEISDVIEGEVREWATKDASIPSANADSSPVDQTSASLPTPVESATRSRQVDICAFVRPNSMSQERPQKKLKRFAEAVGYAALGGLAVGAGLFSVLVATAPDFV
jgi:hypothetical protein